MTTLRWELAPSQPAGLRAFWFLMDGDDRIALLTIQHPAGELLDDTPRPEAWERVKIGPDGEGWLIAGATLEPLPGYMNDWRLLGQQPPPLRDGPLTLTFPSLPRFRHG